MADMQAQIDRWNAAVANLAKAREGGNASRIADAEVLVADIRHEMMHDMISREIDETLAAHNAKSGGKA
jgi:hypothetical protein